ncbi:MAG: NTP transferase domain-containing protein [Acidimicrobiales bacterium]|nr:NTP transferase domain-containing protein [Acidimicrobiales bacterium]
MTVDRQEISLLIMAGGLGSRFGGDKQLVAVGPNGEAFLDYAINDARDLGLGQVVIVARTDLQEPLRSHLTAQHGEDFPATIVHQDTFGPTRAKPWGTGHAVLSATSALTGPVVVVNADDHYGSTGIAQAVKALEGTEGNCAVLVAFELGRTLSATGSVSRGVCQISQGCLEELVETHGIRAEGDRILADDPSGELPADAPVSMNLWGLSGEAVDRLAGQWASFYAQNSDDPSAEFLLPEALDQQRAEGLLEVLVVRSKEKWTGVTSREDLEVAQAAFAD